MNKKESKTNSGSRPQNPGEAADLNTLNCLYRQMYESSCVRKCIPFQGTPEFVFGDGNPAGKLMLVGEAPGKDEVLQERPFVGKAGAILTEFLNSVQIQRGDIYITNAIKYRLSRPGKRTGTLANRPAAKQEILMSAPFLIKEICLVRPLLLVTLGNVPLSCLRCGISLPELLPKTVGAGHGRLYQIELAETFTVELVPLYHPASLIYNPGFAGEYKRDLLFIQELLHCR